LQACATQRNAAADPASDNANDISGNAIADFPAALSTRPAAAQTISTRPHPLIGMWTNMQLQSDQMIEGKF
jgi:hypothetical protein